MRIFMPIICAYRRIKIQQNMDKSRKKKQPYGCRLRVMAISGHVKGSACFVQFMHPV